MKTSHSGTIGLEMSCGEKADRQADRLGCKRDISHD